MTKKNFYIWLIGILIFAVIFVPIIHKRYTSLKNDGVKSICKLVKIKESAKGTVTRKTLAYIEYFVNGEKYKGTTDAFSDTPIGNCYEIVLVPATPKIFEVDFNKPIPCDSFGK